MKEKIMDFIRRKGPVFPTDISSELGMESYFASAYLSEMLSKKEISISFMKVGSSPLYFLPEQKPMLEMFSDKLNEKDKRAYDELKDKKVLRDSGVTPLLRVSLKGIKDFAVPLEVTFNNQKELFWKFYSVSSEDVTEKIKKILSGSGANELLLNSPKKEILDNNQGLNQGLNQDGSDLTNLSSGINNSELSKKTLKDSEELKEEILKVVRKEQESQKEKEEIERLKREIERLKKDRITKSSDTKEILRDKLENKNLDIFDIKSRLKENNDKFMKKIIKYFEDKEIEVDDFKIIKKNSEIDLFVKIPTTLGKMSFLCKAKDKKRIVESDLDLAYASGVNSKMSVIFLTTGEMSKKVKDHIVTFKGMKYIQF